MNSEIVIDGTTYVKKEEEEKEVYKNQILDPELDNPKWNECNVTLDDDYIKFMEDSTYEYYNQVNHSFIIRVKK